MQQKYAESPKHAAFEKFGAFFQLETTLYQLMSVQNFWISVADSVLLNTTVALIL
jgi:hypothetical protein